MPSIPPEKDALPPSLSDVIREAGINSVSESLRTALVNPAPDASIGVPQHRPLASLGGSSGVDIDSRLLFPHQNTLFPQSRGLPELVSLALGTDSTTGLGTEGILPAIAAANGRSLLMEQARASLQQQIAEERRRVLLGQSYIDFLRGSTQVLPNTQNRPPPVPKLPISGDEVLDAIGSRLRTKTDQYIDVSNVADPDPADSIFRRGRGGVETFPEKLHRMLKEVEEEGQSGIVSFFSHGRAFGIHDMERFVSEIMSKYFKLSKVASFQRQLNLYGFIRITSGPDAGGYYHELFLKGRPHLCHHMRRVGVPRGEDRRKFRPKSKNTEPDFYAMKKIIDQSPTA